MKSVVLRLLFVCLLVTLPHEQGVSQVRGRAESAGLSPRASSQTPPSGQAPTSLPSRLAGFQPSEYQPERLRNPLPATRYPLPALADASLPRAFFPGVNNVLAPSGEGTFVLCGSTETDSVFAVKLPAGERLGEVAVGDGPTHVIVQGTQAAVFNTATLALPRPTISILDIADPANLRVTATCTFPEKLTVTYARETLIFSRDGRVVFSCAVDKKNRGTLFAFDTQTGMQLGSVAIGDIPINAALQERNGVRTIVIVTAPEKGGTLVMVNATSPAAMRPAGTFPLPGKPQLLGSTNAAVNETANLGYIALPQSRQLVTFRVEPPMLLDQSSVGQFASRVVLRGNRLLVQEEGEASVAVFDVSQPEQPGFLARFESGGTSLFGSPAFSADGKTGFALAPFESTLFAFDIETGARRSQLATQAELPFNFVVGGTTGAVLIPSSRRIECFDTAGTALQRTGVFFTSNGVAFDFKQAPLVTGDGKRAYIASSLTNEILEIDPETAAVVGRIPTDAGPSNLTLFETPGVRKLAVTTTIGSTVNLFTEQTDGTWKKTGVVALPGENSYLFDFANVVVSRDGTVGFVADVQKTVYAFAMEGGQILGKKEVGDFPAALSLFETTAGERRLAVAAGSLGQKTIVTVMDAANPQNLQPLATVEVDKDTLFALDNVPLFSTDGKTLYLGASFSGELLTIDIKNEQILGRVKGINAAQIVPFEQKGKPAYLAANLQNGKIMVLSKDPTNGLAKGLRVLPPKDNFFLVSNVPTVLAGNKQGVIGSYGLKSAFVFSTEENKILKQIPIPGAVGRLTLLPNGQALLGVEVNGAANRIFRVNLN